MQNPRPISPRLASALPFWLSLALVPLIVLAATQGGWMIILPLVYTGAIIPLLDLLTGLNTANPDPETPEGHLTWFKAITLIWAPVQAALLFGALFYVTRATHLSGFELICLFYTMGIATGSVGIVYAHELMHQKSTTERWLGDLLMAMVLYSHFRSEHLRVHHLWVGTPRDAVTARYNEGFWRFFGRVLLSCPGSAWRAEVAMLKRAGKGRFDLSNPFWRYGALQLGFTTLAIALGGWLGLALFVWQSLVAVLQLELTNYIEHYGLTRRHLGEGRYEPVMPRHSWNASHRVSNWFLINLQRHSDHHYKPSRRYPLLQTYSIDEAPQLPVGYPSLVAVAAIPPWWRRLMNPRVRAWRKQFYPDITDWSGYKAGTTPMPKGSA